MRIKRLDITGFKSFMSKTVFVFDDGVTGIVGPNGCGKSNVVDAIRWVMGEQSARHLRGRSMEDVIFNGSEKHTPLGMAEVSITFVNDQGLVPQQYADLHEITVTRRLFRNGESEYRINKATCRLLDVIELFLGTGVGTKAYSIIEQGRIGLIVSAKPEDRRSLIEEAAGITKYKARRRSAQRKMEQTEQNLLRLSDILGEQRKRLESLERQAQKAERYKELRGEIRQADLHLASMRWLELQAIRAGGARVGEGARLEQKTLATQVEETDTRIGEARGALTQDAAALEKLGEEVAALSQGAALNQTNLDFFERERRQFEERRHEIEEEIASHDERLRGLDEEEAQIREQVAGMAQREEVGEDDLTAREEQVEAARQDEREAAERLEEERTLAMEVLSRAAAIKGELIHIDRRRSDLVDAIARLQAESEAGEQEIEKLEKERAELAERAGSSRQLKLELETRKGEEAELLEQLRQDLFQAEERLITIREEHADKRSRLGSLEEIQRSYEGYGRGVRAVMTRDGEDAGPPAGVVGLLSELIAVPPDYEPAVEAVLGERLQAIVVDSPATAIEWIRYLADAREGRGTFLPLALPQRRSLQPLEDPRILARAIDRVDAGAHAPLAEALLGDVLVVSFLEEAVELVELGTGHTFVTLSGEVVFPYGGLVGGDGEGAGAGLLQKKREVEELREQVASLGEQVALATEQHKRLATRCEELDRSLQGLERTGHAEDLQLLTVEKDLGRTTEELARIRSRSQAVLPEIDGVQNQLALLDVEAESIRGAAAQAEADQAAREERTAALAANLAAAREEVARATSELTRLRIEAAQAAERRDAIDRALVRVAEERERTKVRRERAHQQIEEAGEKLRDLERRMEETSGSIVSLADELEEAKGRLAQERERVAAEQERVEAEESALRELRRNLERAASAASEWAVRDREITLELEHLADGIRERYHLELVDRIQEFHLAPLPGAEVGRRLTALRTQVERMGEVNLTALEEHEELLERFEFLERQRLDLETSLVKLRQAIAKIDATSKERFQETFRIVDEKFQQVFPRLFGGGQAKLLQVRDENRPDAEPGIEIVAQPPGKKMQNVNLMSGGEKALTAVSLIFAIFLIKPTPFCLLDEVDAPLDEANVGRYNDMVKEMSSTSQFILITHNKRTMEIADTLYGVTMEEPGVSKTVSVKLSQAAEAEHAAAAASEAPEGTGAADVVEGASPEEQDGLGAA
jgi:chromosome segregation protein